MRYPAGNRRIISGYAAVSFGVDRIPAVRRKASKNRSPINRPSILSRDRSGSANRVVSRVPDVLSGETLDRFLEGFPMVDRERAEASLEMTLKDAKTHA
jgi:hypothetical protein